MLRNSPFRRFLADATFTAVLLFAISLPIQAQETSERPYPSIDNPSLHLGATVGAGYSQIYFVPSVSQKPHFGTTLGMSVQLENGKYTGMHAELRYTLRGWTEKFIPKEEGASPPRYSRDLHYIELPLMASFHFPIGSFRMGLKIGPQIGYLFVSKASSSNAELFTEVEQQRHNIPLTGKFAWGVAAGPSLAYSFGKQRIELEARFYMGFNDLISTTLADRYSQAGEMVGFVTISYLFQLL